MKTNWLILRGLAREQRHWNTFPSVFEQSVPNARVHCLDLPGVGTENIHVSPTNVHDIMTDIRMRWKVLSQQHDGPWGLFGISLGGMIAMQWCATYPEDFEHLVVVNSSASNLSNPLKRMNKKVVPQLARAIFETDPVSREKRVLSFTACLVDDPDLIAKRSVQILDERPISRLTVLSQLIAATRFKAPERIDTPMLVLAGAKDPLADPQCAWRLSRHFEAPLCVHPYAGHDLSLDDPEWLAGQVKAWLHSKPATTRLKSAIAAV